MAGNFFNFQGGTLFMLCQEKMTLCQNVRLLSGTLEIPVMNANKIHFFLTGLLGVYTKDI